MTAPTTRETADHAELARLAEAAKTVRRDANGRLDGDDAVRMWVAFHDALSPATVLALLSEIAALRGERERLRNVASKSNEEVCQSLGKALGYPWFKDDQANFPGSTEEHGVCVGDHVAESIADEAARCLTQAERQRDELRKALEFYAQPIWSIRGEFPEPSPHSEYRPDCGDTARQALDNQGADQ